MKKRILATLLTAIMLFTLLPTGAMAEGDVVTTEAKLKSVESTGLENILKISYSADGNTWTAFENTYIPSDWSVNTPVNFDTTKDFYLKVEKGAGCTGKISSVSVAWQCKSDDPAIKAHFEYSALALGNSFKVPVSKLGVYDEFDGFYVSFETTMSSASYGTYYLEKAIPGSAENNAPVADILRSNAGLYTGESGVALRFFEKSGIMETAISNEITADGTQATSEIGDVYYSVSNDGTVSTDMFFKFGFSVNAYFTLNPSTNTLTANGNYTYRKIGDTGYNKTGSFATGETFTKSVPVATIGNAQYESITEAIDAAVSGDTINVLPGTYDEVISPWTGSGNSQHTCEKSITLLGGNAANNPNTPAWSSANETILTGGMYIGYDHSQTRDHTITIKGFTFQGKGLTVADQKDVVIENNKFTSITTAEAIAVLDQECSGKQGSVIVKNNYINDVVTHGSGAGINLRNPYHATVTGNYIENTNHNAILLQKDTLYIPHNGTVVISGNTMINWDANNDTDGGRAIRAAFEGTSIGLDTLEKNITFSGNKLVKTKWAETPVDSDFVKFTGTGNNAIDMTLNYWASGTPNFAAIVADPNTAAHAITAPYYTAEGMSYTDRSDYVPVAPPPPITPPTTETVTDGTVTTETTTETKVDEATGTKVTEVVEKSSDTATGTVSESATTVTENKDGIKITEAVIIETTATGATTEIKKTVVEDTKTGASTATEIVKDSAGKTTASVETAAKAETTTTGNSATATVSSATVTGLVEQAKTAAAASSAAGASQVSATVTIKAETSDKVQSVSVSIPAEAISAINEAGVQAKISTPIADIILDSKTLDAVKDVAGSGPVTITATAKSADTLPEAAKEALSEAVVIDFEITSGDNTVSDFRGGTVAVAIPFTPKATTKSVSVYYVDAQGEMALVPGAYYMDGKVFFSTGHFSTYAIMEETIPFTDMLGHWAKASVAVVYENKLFNGVSATQFDPEGQMTRSMLATTLYRLAGMPDTTGMSLGEFTDTALIPDWATIAMRWAIKNDIVAGRSGTQLLDPLGNVTRQELVTMLWRFAKLQGKDVSIGENTNILSYVDYAKISEYAIPAFQWACGAKLISGKPDGILDPLGSATRAEVATVYANYLA